MSLKDDRTFRKFLETQQNPYELVLDVASDAKRIATEYNNLIPYSEAITHSLHGTRPKLKNIYKWESEAKVLRDIFCQIEDKEICDAVYDSFYASKESQNLVYCYGEIKEPYRQARVRILVRMLWLDMYEFL